MTLRDFEQLFKDVVAGYPGITLHYAYNRAWHFDGTPSAEFPAVLLERMPKVNWGRLNNNLLPSTTVVEFKVFFFDTYHAAERESKEYSQKQTELIEIARQVFAELSRLDRERGNDLNFKYNGQFLGDIDMNVNELLEFSCTCQATLRNDCNKLTFSYV